MKLVLVAMLAFSFYSMEHACAYGKGGDEFRKTASVYSAKAKKFRKKGRYKLASIYNRKAQIKKAAAKLADQEKWELIDWAEYEALEKKEHKLLKK